MRPPCALEITPDLAGPLHDGICRAVEQGLRITRPPETARFGERTYWTVDSTSTPGAVYVVLVEQQPDGAVWAWCECPHNTLGNKVCKHIALAIDRMGLIPRVDT